MTWPLYVAGAITVLAQMIGTGEEAKPKPVSVPKKASGAGGVFMSGLVLGASIGWFLREESRRRRFVERLRKSLSDLQGSDEPQANPEQTLDGGIVIRTLISPNTALTSALHMRLITLPAGTQLAKQRSEGVEHYYVLKGSCTIIMNENEHNISDREGFTVNPWRERVVANQGLTKAIVLRTTDGGSAYDREGFDEGVSEPLTMTRAAKYVSSNVQTGMQYVQSIVSNSAADSDNPHTSI